MNHSFRSHHHRPPWWPKNEPWPPHGRMRRPFFQRMGCLFGLFNLFGLAALLGITALVAHFLGLVKLPFHFGEWSMPIAAGSFFFIVLLISLAGMGLWRVIVPLDDLLKAADRVGQGDYSTRVLEKGPREVRKLARSFNDMASRLHSLDEQRRDLLADVTHELRTPLTVIQGNLEGMLDGVYPADESTLRAVLNETNILSGLVEDLRTLTLAESGALQLKKEMTDLALLIRETIAAFQTQAAAAGLTLRLEMEADLPWLELDPGRVRQVLVNLLANALRYTSQAGMVSIRYHQTAVTAELEVQDSSPGIPADELPHVFERFYKSTDSGGLGLAIAKKTGRCPRRDDLRGKHPWYGDYHAGEAAG